MRRIESKNPNPKMPLVRYEGGTWRVGGLLALSRAFGDAYLKGSLQFEGITEGPWSDEPPPVCLLGAADLRLKMDLLPLLQEATATAAGSA